MTTLNEIMATLNTVNTSTGMNKSASVNKVAQAENDLKQALNMAVKTASTQGAQSRNQGDVVSTLTKMASEMAACEEQLLRKQASLFGAAFADGCLAQFSQYDDLAKTASVVNPGGDVDGELLKQAEELGFKQANDEINDMCKQAMEQGYADAQTTLINICKDTQGLNSLAKTAGMDDTMRKIASMQQGYWDAMQPNDGLNKQAMDQGYADALTILNSVANTKTASANNGFNKRAMQQGYADAHAILTSICRDTAGVQRLAKTAGVDDSLKKIASMQQGYHDAMQEIHKVASVSANKGYADTVKVLRKVASR